MQVFIATHHAHFLASNLGLGGAGREWRGAISLIYSRDASTWLGAFSSSSLD